LRRQCLGPGILEATDTTSASNAETMTVALDRGAYVDSSLVSVPTTLSIAAVHAVSTPLVVSPRAGPNAFIKAQCLSLVVGLHLQYALGLTCFGIHVKELLAPRTYRQPIT
jgi:hypothetical protein